MIATHSRLPTLRPLRGLILGLSMAAPTTVLAGSTYAEFDLQLAFVATTSEITSPGLAAKASDPATSIQEGQTFRAQDVLTMSRAKPSISAPQSLFENARLSVTLDSRDGSLALEEVIASCAHLDLYSSQGETFQEKATCDGATYGVNVTRRGVAITLNNSPYRLFALREGTYLLNGVPFRIDPK